MKFVKKLAGDMKANWDNLNNQQKLAIFDLTWEGNQIPNNRLINRLKDRLPGLHYKRIYVLINQIIISPAIGDVEKLEKELKDFYSRPITPEQKQYYPVFKAEIEGKLFPLDTTWLKEKILPDIKVCEEIQKKRAMKRYGLL